MADLNKPYDINNAPAVPPPAPEISPIAEVNPPPPAESSAVPPPTVVVPGSAGSVPKWFYFIFGLTLIVFFIITTLIVLQLIQKPSGVADAVPTITPQVTSKNGSPTPTLAVMTATDSAITKLNELGNSDEVASIEADLKNTDLTVLDQSIAVVDNQTGSF